MPATDKLKADLHQSWAARMDRIKAANQDFGSRLQYEQLVFDLDLDDDLFTVTIGRRPDFVYTQGDDHMYVDVDEKDRVVAITIHEFSAYLREHSVLRDLAAVLRLLGRFEVPAGTGDRSQLESLELLPI